MEFVITEVGGATIAALDGRLDTVNVDKIELTFSASILPQARNTIIDLSKVTFIASLGIRLLLTTARTLGQRGAKLVMFGANPAVAEILETTALSDIIPVFLSEQEAIAAVSA
jgi:anti-sigma B factor antagonist